MDFDDLMPVGECIVYDRQLDHSEAGFCSRCKGPFCWGDCGGWFNGEHTCNNCQEIDED